MIILQENSMSSRTYLSVLIAVTAIALLTACGGGEQRQVIQNKGSDTLVNVAQAWAEAYQVVNPSVVVAVSGGGSGTGIAALINGTVDIANASRSIKDKELKLAQDNGQDPVQHVVGFDALAVYLHPDNPLGEISIAQLAEIYADGGSYLSWNDLGVEVPGCKDQEIVVVSRQNNSGTYAYFREAVLGDADFKLGTRDMHGSKDVVDLVENTPCAIGYSGLAYATEHVKLACIAQETGGACTNPSVASAVDGSYPIARPLFMYTNGQPAGFVGDYLNWIMSNEGQCIILNKGYAPATKVDCG
jgi:phosphate transport system substrate-binding protein